MKNKIKGLGSWIEDKLRALCGEITPDKRLTVIIVMLSIFTIINVYFTFSTIYNWGKDSAGKDSLKLEHIEQMELDRNRNRDYIDSEIKRWLYDVDSINYHTKFEDSIA